MRPTLYVELVDRLVDAVIEDDRARALWIEGETLQQLRRPFGRVRVHLDADEPAFPELVEGLENLLSGISVKVSAPRWSDTIRNARQLDASIEIQTDGDPLQGEITFVVECSAFLAKRRRKAVLPIVDKTTHLTHVMDFSRD